MSKLASSLILTSRPVSWINTAYPFAVAFLLAGGCIDWRWIVGSVFFLVPYNLVMYGVNDVFDYESDLRNPRKGGAEGALLERSVHRQVLWACLLVAAPFLVALASGGGGAANLALALSMAALLAYSAPGLRFKERPFLDSLTSAVHFVSPGVYGWLLAGGELTLAPLAAFGAFLLWGMASHALGAIQDIEPDRRAGLGSIATVLGARRTARLVALWYVLAGLLVLLVPGEGRWAALLAVPYLCNVLPYLNLADRDAGTAHRGWVRFLWLNYLAGFLLTMLLIYLGWRR
ncbi:prenyltransferase [Glutamicibacter sp. MNS18]|uniref:prenyltransferase n=1 Tax=Glutamicibacter sp. MNS18 TaxID=2989817 RepID=UPI00223664C5|nr:prenyltransferase [Glutamicibacter sp. MNS18]MCW4466116.1 prenyltransferase [Glutamicibacter sp. MNS18]